METVPDRGIEPQGDQAPKADAPFKDELTVIWAKEKREIREQLDAHAQILERLSQCVKTLEDHVLKKVDRTAWDASHKGTQTLGAGIGQAVPKPRSTAVRLPPEATEYVPSPMEKDYEGPREGPHGNVGPS